MLVRAVAPPSDQLPGQPVAVVGCTLKVGVDGHVGCHPDEDRRGDVLRVGRRGGQHYEGPHRMTDQVRRGAEVFGHFGHPGAHPVDGGHGWPVGLSVPREVHRRGPVAVVG